MELQNGRGLACEVSTLLQQACTLSSHRESCCHQSLVFICEVVWLLHHTFCNHLGNPLGGIPLSVWSIPSYFLVLWFSQRPRGAVVMWCVCMSVCYACLCMHNCHGVPSFLQIHCPELALYFECWSPHPQTVDTELLSQRLAEYHYCLPKHMHGHAASAL